MEKCTFPIGGEAQTKNEQAMPRNIQYGCSRNHAGKTQKTTASSTQKGSQEKHLGTPRNSTGSKATYENMFEARGLCPLRMIPEIKKFRSRLI